MVISQQISLFTYCEDVSFDNIMPSLRLFGPETPYALVKEGIERFSKRGDQILDPFANWGITGIVSLEMGRKALLTEQHHWNAKGLKALFGFFDYNRLKGSWEKIKDTMGVSPDILADDTKVTRRWEGFIQEKIPTLSSMKRVHRKQVKNIGELFHPTDVETLEQLFYQISLLQDQATHDLLEIIFDLTLLESCQLTLSKNGRDYYIPKNIHKRNPVQIFSQRLDSILDLKTLLREQIARNFTWTPRIQSQSPVVLNHVPANSIDYIIGHFPDESNQVLEERLFLLDQLYPHKTDSSEPFRVNLDFRGRSQFIINLSRFLQEMERVLIDKGYLTIIIGGDQILLSFLIQQALEQGWILVNDAVTLANKPDKDAPPFISVTLQKKANHTVLGALNKMKSETLYDNEEAILRKIDQYLERKKSATTQEIQRYLLENYLHDCLIEKPLNRLLSENFLYSGQLWLRPSPEQKKDLYQKRRTLMRQLFAEFLQAMTYNILSEEGEIMSYTRLLQRFLKIRPRMIFHTPYYRLLMEECEERKIKLHQLMKELLLTTRKDSFETLEEALRRLLKGEKAFLELSSAEHLGLSHWSADLFFKKYLELYEKARTKHDQKNAKKFAQDALGLLEQVTYLESRKKVKLQGYLERSGQC